MIQPHLRIESDGTEIRLSTLDGRTLAPDMVTVIIQAGRIIRIKAESMGKKPEYMTCHTFYANGRKGKEGKK